MPQAIELISELEKIQRRANKFILHLPFITKISYKERSISLDPLPLYYWHELLDMFSFFTRLLIIWSTLVLPLFPSRAKALERLEHPLLAFLSLSPRDVELQRIRNLFFIRTTRIWKLLTGRMDLANATLNSFKSLLYDYYSRAVRINYNLDNP